MGKSFWEDPSAIGIRGSFGNSYWAGPEDCEDSGCMFTIRAIKDEKRDYKFNAKGKISLSKSPEGAEDKDYDEDVDGDWVEPSDDSDDEPLEYMSEESDSEVEGRDTDVEMTDADDASEEESLTREQIRKFWLSDNLEVWITKELLHNAESFNELTDNNAEYTLPAWYRGRPYEIEVEMKDGIVDDMFPLYNSEKTIVSGSGGMTLRPRTNKSTKDPNPTLSERELLEKRLAYNTKDDLMIEHIAGPECNNATGYSGHEISADEMRGCQTVQCLVRKPPGYRFDALPDDEDFETNGEFFLSGLSDHMPSRDDNSPRVTPHRHGCERPHAENCMWEDNVAHDYAIPFHPTCFEVYKRMSSMTRGKIDVSTLTSWWSLEADYNTFHAFPRDKNVWSCNKQEWSHDNGTEYLVANPLYIPQLRDIFVAAVDTGPDFSPRNGAFTILEPMRQETVVDQFDRLPVELQTQILDLLPSKDIASLRLASRVFTQLPISYFQSLLLREHPWLWEVWPTGLNPAQPSYAKWAYSTASELSDRTTRQARDFTILADYCYLVKKEIPESAAEVDAAYEVQVQAIQESHRQAEPEEGKPFYLPPAGTNYFVLYTLVTRHWKQLRGLQNRKRIWKDCEEILRRADKYREEGRIDGTGRITEDLREVVKENQRKQREARTW
jgi:hypothetical protein